VAAPAALVPEPPAAVLLSVAAPGPFAAWPAAFAVLPLAVPPAAPPDPALVPVPPAAELLSFALPEPSPTAQCVQVELSPWEIELGSATAVSVSALPTPKARTAQLARRSFLIPYFLFSAPPLRRETTTRPRWPHPEAPPTATAAAQRCSIRRTPHHNQCK